VSPELVRIGTRLAALEMLQSGTTLHTDMYYFEEEVARATKEAGLRGVLARRSSVSPWPMRRRPRRASRAPSASCRHSRRSLVVATVAPHSMYTVDAGTLRAARDLARAYGVAPATHLAETATKSRSRWRSTA